MRHAAAVERREWRRRVREECGWLSSARLRHGLELVVLDVGRGGAFVEAPARLLPGARVELHLEAPGWRWVGPARVLRCHVSALLPEHGARYRAALQFVRPLDPPARVADDPGSLDRARTPRRLDSATPRGAGSGYP